MCSTRLTELDLRDHSSRCSEARLRYLRLAIREGTYRPPGELVADALLVGSLIAVPPGPRPVA